MAVSHKESLSFCWASIFETYLLSQYMFKVTEDVGPVYGLDLRDELELSENYYKTVQDGCFDGIRYQEQIPLLWAVFKT